MMKKHSGAVGWRGGLIVLCLAAPSLSRGLEKGSGNGLHGALRGEIRMTMQNGGTDQEIRYRYTETQLRIDRPGEVIPSPAVNLLDLETGTLCIIHPHNGTWEQGAVGRVADPILHIPGSAIPAAPHMAPPADWPEMPENLPEGIGPGAAQAPSPSASIPGMPAGGMPAFPAMPVFPTPGIGGQDAVGGVGDPAKVAGEIGDPALLTPGATRRKPPVDWPGMPENLPEGIGPGAAQAPSPTTSIPGMPAGGTSSGMPDFPAMPAFPTPGMGGQKSMSLVFQNQTNELFGFSCRLYEMAVPDRGTLSLWLCDDPGLPLFHLLAYEIQRRQGRSEWVEQVAQLLRKEKMFPFRAVLKGEGGATLAEWSVLSIKTDVEEKDQNGLFDVPAGLHLLPERTW